MAGNIIGNSTQITEGKSYLTNLIAFYDKMPVFVSFTLTTLSLPQWSCILART